MARKQQKLAVVLALFLCLCVTFSSLYLIHEADHVCIGEDCPVCACIASALHLLRTFSLCLTFLLACLGCVSVSEHFRAISAQISPVSTPVACKVRLND